MWLFIFLCEDQLASNRSNNLKNTVTHIHTPFLILPVSAFLASDSPSFALRTCSTLGILSSHAPARNSWVFALSSSLVPRLSHAAGLGTRRSEMILHASQWVCVSTLLSANGERLPVLFAQLEDKEERSQETSTASMLWRGESMFNYVT